MVMANEGSIAIYFMRPLFNNLNNFDSSENTISGG